MKRLVFLFAFLSSPLLAVQLRNPNPASPTQVWQNDQDLRDAINQLTSTIPTSISIYVSSINVSNALTITANGTRGSTPTIGVNPSSVAVLANGLIPNSEIDGSSVTKLGNGNIAFKGRTTNAFQPSFSAYLSSDQNNVTGDGTDYTVPFDTERLDQANNFASNTFTAPVAGNYFLSAQVQIHDATLACEVRLVLTGITYASENRPPIQIGAISINVFVPMGASDTATVHLICSLGGKTMDVLGAGGTTVGSAEPTFFSGFLVN